MVKTPFWGSNGDNVKIIHSNTSVKFVRSNSTIIIIIIRGNSQQHTLELLCNHKQTAWLSAVLTDKPSQSSETWMSLSWVNDRVGGPCQPRAWTGTLTTLQFTPSGQRGRIERRKDEVDDRRNEAVNQMSAKTKGELWKCCQIDVTTEMGALSMTSIFLCELKF